MDTVTSRPITDRPSQCAISWSAIIAGALIAFSLSALLNLLNTGLGLVTFPESFRAITTISIVGYIWLIICGIIAMFIAGFGTGKILRFHMGSACSGALHGFLAWSLALLLTVIIAAHFAAATAAGTASNPAVTSSATDTSQDASASVNDNAGANDNVGEAIQTSQASGTATIGIFFIFLLGAIAAAVGGYVGARSTGISKLEH